MGLELLWRGWSHGSMFLVGGLCFLLLGEIYERLPGLPLFPCAVLGGCVVTGIELLSGLIINRVLGLHVWDYGKIPYNLLGQICPQYFFLWIQVSLMAFFLRKRLGILLFREDGICRSLL